MKSHIRANNIFYCLVLLFVTAQSGYAVETPNQPRYPQEEAIKKEPTPYDSREVSFANPRGGVKLAGVMSVPKGTAPFPGVLFIAASGPETRDENVAGHHVFVVLADYLLRRGIAVLRYDKRGVGSSTGDLDKASFEDLVSDAASAFSFLKTQPEIARDKVGVLGHSEGGSIAPAVAALDRDATFVVAMAGSGLSGRFRVTEMQAYSAKLRGANNEQQLAIRAICKKIFQVVSTSSDDSAANRQIAAIFEKAVAAKAITPEQSAELRRTMTPTFARETLHDNPIEYLKKVRVPVLAFVGSLDRIVPAGPYVEVMRPVLNTIPGSQLEVLPGLNHAMQTAQTGSPAEFATIEETISPAALALIGDWISKQTSSRTKATDGL